MANKGRRNARTTAWHNKRNPGRRPAPESVVTPRVALRMLAAQNLATTQAKVRTLPPGGPLEPYQPAPRRTVTLWEAATGERLRTA